MQAHWVCNSRRIEENVMPMRNAEEEVQEAVWLVNSNMAYCNLLPLVQHWLCVFELNGYLIGLVKFLDARFRIAKRLLRKLAQECTQEPKKEDLESQSKVTSEE